MEREMEGLNDNFHKLSRRAYGAKSFRMNIFPWKNMSTKQFNKMFKYPAKGDIELSK